MNAIALDSLVRYRLATIADTSLLLTMMAAFYAEDAHAFVPGQAEAAIHDLMTHEHYGRLWLIEVEGAIVGYIAVTFGYSLEYHGRDAILDEIYLQAPYRGQGIGTHSLRFVETACRELGITALHLEVMDDNPQASALYRRLGYEPRSSQFLHKWL